MKLVDVYSVTPAKPEPILWALLQERDPAFSISHRAMPTYEQHCAFVRDQPYLAWYFIEDEHIEEGRIVGAVYFSRRREIGVAVFEAHRRRGYAKLAVEELMRLYPDPYLANIAPGNVASQRLFEKLGFKELQRVYQHA